ncbi:MAG: DUF1345 domain-containing protein [Novosphingobium sp.]
MTARPSLPADKRKLKLGNRIAPPRFVLFIVLLLAVLGWSVWGLGSAWSAALMRGFDVAAVAFILSLWPLGRDHRADEMRVHAAQNNANRGVVLLITGIVMLAIMAAIANDLSLAKHGNNMAVAKLVFTLSLAWAFTNMVFTLHYAHIHYGPADTGVGDHGGFEFPGTPEPDYWDFLYFSFTAGMSFAASDVNVLCGRVRRVLVVQCLLSFIFNIGVIAFTINALSGG